jgi:hypothetical protein
MCPVRSVTYVSGRSCALSLEAPVSWSLYIYCVENDFVGFPRMISGALTAYEFLQTIAVERRYPIKV